MAAVIGALRVNLGLNSAEFESGMKKASGAMKALSGAFAALGGVAIFAGFATGITQAVGRIEEARKLTAQLDQALANTGNTAQTSGKEVADFADALEKSTGRAAEEILAVSTNLATFGFNRQVFFEAIELADDMSAAWGGDLKQNVEGLARALADPEKGLAMLTKRGITFTDQQKAMIAGFIKSNDLLGAQGVILDTLQEQVSGVAEAGFTGLTAAQARATKAMEDFFETIAGSLQVNMGLEMSLAAVAAALNFVSANFDVIARAAGVAGTAILTALGPTIWATVSTAAVAMSNSIIAGIRAIGIAIAANPIGLLITAFAAAVAAAFLFRDEIKQAIGIDFVGILQEAWNTIIGGFVGAFEAIKATWSLLPAALGDIVIRTANSVIVGVEAMVNKASDLLRSFLQKYNEGLATMGQKQLPLPGKVDFAGFANPYAGAADAVGGAASAAFAGAQGDYVGKLAETLGFVGDEATTAAAGITALGVSLDGGGTGGGAAGSAKAAGDAMKKLADEGRAVFDATRTTAEKYALEIERLNRLLQAGAIDQDTYNRAVLQAQESFRQAEQSGNKMADSISSSLTSVFTSVVDGSKTAVGAIGDLLKSLGQMLINKGFQALIGGMFGGMFGGSTGGAGVGLGNIFGSLFGFARGGTIMPGGSGGIDSQLVTFRKSPNERVDITKPGQTLATGGGEVTIAPQYNFNGSSFTKEEALQIMEQNNRQLVNSLPDQIAAFNRDPHKRRA